MRKILLIITLVSLASQPVLAGKAKGIDAKYAFQRVGKTVTVCGVVASARYLQGSGREPTFLNFADTYPKHPFTVVIWGKSRDQFDYAPETLEGKSICVRGLIETYKSKPQIVVDSPKQILMDEA
jgi:DNA/RNA endonuclease YhcR with UshA esterase domain